MKVVLRKPLFLAESQSCGCLLRNLVLEDTVATASPRGIAGNRGCECIQREPGPPCGLMFLGGWSSLSIQSQRLYCSGQSISCICCTCCICNVKEVPVAGHSKHSAGVPICHFYYKVTFLHIRTISDQ